MRVARASATRSCGRAAAREARGDRVILRAESVGGGAVPICTAAARRSGARWACGCARAGTHGGIRQGGGYGQAEQAGEWASRRNGLPSCANAFTCCSKRTLAPATALVATSRGRATMPLLGLDRVGRYYLPGSRRRRTMQIHPTAACSDVELCVRSALLVEECERAGTITLARFRDVLGVSRRVAQLARTLRTSTASVAGRRRAAATALGRNDADAACHSDVSVAVFQRGCCLLWDDPEPRRGRSCAYPAR